MTTTQTPTIPQTPRSWLRHIGSKGGSKRTEKQLAAVNKNLARARKIRLQRLKDARIEAQAAARRTDDPPKPSQAADRAETIPAPFEK